MWTWWRSAPPDGNFSTCPCPNPEIREAMEKGLELCEKVRPDLLLAPTRTAIAVAPPTGGKGGYRLITGRDGRHPAGLHRRTRKALGTLPAARWR